MYDSGRRRHAFLSPATRGTRRAAAGGRGRRALTFEGLERRTLLAHTPVALDAAAPDAMEPAAWEAETAGVAVDDSICPCSNVSVRVQHQTLWVWGDEESNFIQLTMDAQNGMVSVTGLGTTRINHDVQPFTTLISSIRDIEVRLLSGADQLIVGDGEAPFLLLGADSDLRVETGSGADIVVLVDVVAEGDVSIQTEDGDDDLDILGSTFQDGARVEIRMGDGLDHLLVRDTVFEDRTLMALGRHADIMILERVAMDDAVEVDAGPEGDWVFWSGFEATGELELDVQDGDDTVLLENGTLGREFRLDADRGDDIVALDGIVNASAAELDGGRGDDLLATTVEVRAARFEEVLTEFDRQPLLDALGQELAARLGLDPEQTVVTSVADAGDLVLDFVTSQTDHRGAPAAADVDQDGDVDSADLVLVIINWTRWWDPRRDSQPGDIDCDGDVDSADLTILITQWTGSQDGGETVE